MKTTQTQAEFLKVGDKVISTDNRKWTIDDVKSRYPHARYEVYAHNGQENKRFDLRFNTQVIIETRK